MYKQTTDRDEWIVGVTECAFFIHNTQYTIGVEANGTQFALLYVAKGVEITLAHTEHAEQIKRKPKKRLNLFPAVRDVH